MFDSELSIQAVNPTTWRVIAPMVWTGQQGDTFTVPIGFTTDFATVPRFLHWLVLPYGAYTRAAVLHDWLLTELAAWDRDNDGHVPGIAPAAAEPSHPPADSRDTDGIFRVAMRDLGVPWAKRWTMWAAVRAASCFNSRRAYGRDFMKDAPKVAGIALVTGPVILPGAIGVLISLGIVRIYTVLSGGAPPIRKSRRGRPAGTPEGKDHA
jgi:hypothetical protein